MRICDLTTLYLDGGQGGVNTYLEEKARYLSTRPDVSHVIIVPGARDERRQLFNSTLYTIKSPRLPSNPEHRVLTPLGEVQRLLLAEAPAVVEVDCAYLLGKVAATALAARNVPVLGFYHVHLPAVARPSATTRLSSVLAGTAELCAWRYAGYCQRYLERVIVSSNNMRSQLLMRGFTELEHVPLGVNLELFRPRSTPRPEGPVTILSVARLSPEKDQPMLVEAFQRLAARGDYRLVLVGNGPMRRKLERQAGGDPRIEFLGSRPYGPALAELYRQADLLAVPGPCETFNLTVLEGLASGLPVVAVNRGGPVDLVAPEVGVLAIPGDPGDFADKLEHVATRLDQYRACRAHVERLYSWERTFSRLLSVYEAAIQRRAVRTGATA